MSRRSKKKITSAAHRPGTSATEPGGWPRRFNNRWALVCVCLALAAMTWFVFGQTRHFQFVNYDDDPYVVKNAQVSRGLTLEGIGWAFTHMHADNWHPVTWISHMLDAQLYGLNPGGHHLTNVLIHTLTAILLFLVLRQMTGALWRSAFVAALFAIHPLRVESVAWVAERKDVLSALFFLLTIGAYVRYARAPWSGPRYGVVVVLFAVGLMCKPMLVTVPFVLLLLDYWPLDRFANPSLRQRLILEKLPLLAMGLASCAVTLLAQRGAMQPVTRISLPMRFGNAVISYTDYLRQMFWPTDLAVLYPWEDVRIGFSNTVLSIVILVSVSATVLILHRRRYLLTGWLWYLVMLGPVIGILQVGNQARADRYTYLPQIGLYVLLAWGAADIPGRWRYRPVLVAGLASVILAALMFAARAQTAYWQDSETLWSHALACTTDNVIAEGNLGQAYFAKGKKREAILHFQNSLRIGPNQASLHSSLGVFYLELGEIDQSLAHLEKAVAIEPKFGDAHYNLGNTYLQMGRWGDAVAQYNKALESNPDDIEALNNMAWILATSPDPFARDGVKAVALAQRAIDLTPGGDPVLSATLAAAYAEAGRFADAIAAGRRALDLATAQGNAGRAESIRAQIALYQSGAAFRDHRFSPTGR